MSSRGKPARAPQASTISSKWAAENIGSNLCWDMLGSKSQDALCCFGTVLFEEATVWEQNCESNYYVMDFLNETF